MSVVISTETNYIREVVIELCYLSRRTVTNQISCRGDSPISCTLPSITIDGLFHLNHRVSH